MRWPLVMHVLVLQTSKLSKQGLQKCHKIKLHNPNTVWSLTMLVQINHLLFNCYLKNKSWRPMFVSVSQISKVEPLRQNASSSLCRTTDTVRQAGELWYPFWLAGARLSHCGNTLVVRNPFNGIKPHNLGYPCHHVWMSTRGSTMTANTGNEKTIFKAVIHKI